MPARDMEIVNLRAAILQGKAPTQMSRDERFQTQTLRPIMELQKELLLAVFQNYFRQHKNVFYTLSPEKKVHYIEHVIQKDMKFRNSLIGIIIGQFTLPEYQIYTQNTAALNKRMVLLINEEIQNQLLLLESIPPESFL